MAAYKEGDQVKVCNKGRWVKAEICWLCCKDPEAYMVELRDGTRGDFDLDHITPQ